MRSSDYQSLSGLNVALLVGGGIESSVLLAVLSKVCRQVTPVFIRSGLAWEKAELKQLGKFIDALAAPGIAGLKVMDLPVNDIYDSHWSLSGIDVPDRRTPDEAVYLPGRNLLLIAKVVVWASLNDVEAIGLGVLKGNPFSDAKADFFNRLEETAGMALKRPIKIVRPFNHLCKSEVIEMGRCLPLQHTFSCIAPAWADDGEPLHCGQCNKCYERMTGFAGSRMQDRTRYARAGPAMNRHPARF